MLVVLRVRKTSGKWQVKSRKFRGNSSSPPQKFSWVFS
jgi:hypothetical protein